MELVDVCTDNIIAFLAESLPVGFGIVDEAVDEDVEEMDTYLLTKTKKKKKKNCRRRMISRKNRLHH